MNRWCVSREDLKQFQRLVWRAVQDGYILPQERDLFDPTDCTVGPSMYTVVEQYIKPMTQAAGNVSWALLAHPEGLQCDLFITHCWAEGIFEFVEKATRSWPHGAKAAYICFLSNPQNLDVSHLIQDPAESPFAKALEAAKHVLAIPNSKVSIYTRIWCVYEAFLAHTQGKFILTAKTVKHAFWLQVLRVSFVYLASVTASTWMGSLVSQELTEQFVLPPLILTVLFGIAHLFLCNHYSRFPCITRCVVYLIAISCGVVLGLRLNTPSEIELLAAVFLFFCTGALEADRLEGKEGAQQAANLRNNFTGHLADAECSDDADKRRICAELTNSGQEEAVEEAVAVLMHMNISTPELRSTMLRTGTLGDATSLSGSFMILGMSLFFLQPCAVCIDWYLLVNIFQIHWLCIMLALGILEFLFLSLLLLCYAIWCPDRWTFAVRSQAMWFLILPAEAMTSTLHPEIIANVVAVSIFILGPCILILAILGPARMSRVPIFGAALVRLIYGRAPWKTPCAKCTKPSGTSPRRQ
ncbi:unnamed protein product [Effrenium voratum]|uniref:Uncharacterized protein n=1 Tax=Effrenium voratum TaxID=2562239 RepID=A0AA36IEL3_9DINO|nr:unnamed protein product [Effrenium voratum]